MKLLLVDDEPLARLRLAALVAELAGELQATVAGEAGDADEALALLRESAVDVVLLDIGLPGRDGLRVAAALKALPVPPAVVFVTAHSQHALAAFELDAVDYLTKPVRVERLRDALSRVQLRLRDRRAAAATAAAAAGATPALVVSERGRVLRLPLPDVLLLKAEQKYVTLRTVARVHVLDEPLAELESRLAALGGAFVRIHRNALVARHALRALELRAGTGGDGWAVRVAPLDEWLAVSRRQVAAVRAVLEGSG